MRLFLILMVAVVVALSGCGGDDDDSGLDDWGQCWRRVDETAPSTSAETTPAETTETTDDEGSDDEGSDDSVSDDSGGRAPTTRVAARTTAGPTTPAGRAPVGAAVGTSIGVRRGQPASTRRPRLRRRRQGLSLMADAVKEQFTKAVAQAQNKQGASCEAMAGTIAKSYPDAVRKRLASLKVTKVTVNGDKAIVAAKLRGAPVETSCRWRGAGDSWKIQAPVGAGTP